MSDSKPPLPRSSSSRPATPSRPPVRIDYAMRAPKKPFTLPRHTFLFVKMFFVLVAALAMGYFALVALNPKARAWATQGGADGSGGPTPFKAVNQILAIPARAIGKTKDVVAASDARTGVLNKVIKEEENNAKGAKESRPLTDPFAKSATAASGGKAGAAAKDADDNSISRERLLALAAESAASETATEKPAPARPAPVAPPPPPGPAEMKLGGGIVITNVGAPDGTPASAPFMYWAAGLNVSGVSNSTPARFLMDGKLVREGDEVNKTLDITFERLDPAAKAIHFRDKNGAVVTRSY